MIHLDVRGRDGKKPLSGRRVILIRGGTRGLLDDPGLAGHHFKRPIHVGKRCDPESIVRFRGHPPGCSGLNAIGVEAKERDIVIPTLGSVGIHGVGGALRRDNAGLIIDHHVMIDDDSRAPVAGPGFSGERPPTPSGSQETVPVVFKTA